MDPLLYVPDSVPFSIAPSTADLMQGVLEIHGLLHFDGRQVVVEYRPTSMTTLQSGEVVSREIPLAALQDVRCKKSLLGARIELEARRLSTFEGIPGCTGNTLPLRVPRKARQQAQRLASVVQLRLSEVRLEGLDE